MRTGLDAKTRLLYFSMHPAMLSVSLTLPIPVVDTDFLVMCDVHFLEMCICIDSDGDDSIVIKCLMRENGSFIM